MCDEQCVSRVSAKWERLEERRGMGGERMMVKCSTGKRGKKLQMRRREARRERRERREREIGRGRGR